MDTYLWDESSSAALAAAAMATAAAATPMMASSSCLAALVLRSRTSSPQVRERVHLSEQVERGSGGMPSSSPGSHKEEPGVITRRIILLVTVFPPLPSVVRYFLTSLLPSVLLMKVFGSPRSSTLQLPQMQVHTYVLPHLCPHFLS